MFYSSQNQFHWNTFWSIYEYYSVNSYRPLYKSSIAYYMSRTIWKSTTVLNLSMTIQTYIFFDDSDVCNTSRSTWLTRTWFTSFLTDSIESVKMLLGSEPTDTFEVPMWLMSTIIFVFFIFSKFFVLIFFRSADQWLLKITFTKKLPTIQHLVQH